MSPSMWWCYLAFPGITNRSLFLIKGCISTRLKVLPPEIIVPLKIMGFPNWGLEATIILELTSLLNATESRYTRIFGLSSAFQHPTVVLRWLIRDLQERLVVIEMILLRVLIRPQTSLCHHIKVLLSHACDEIVCADHVRVRVSLFIFRRFGFSAFRIHYHGLLLMLGERGAGNVEHG